MDSESINHIRPLNGRAPLGAQLTANPTLVIEESELAVVISMLHAIADGAESTVVTRSGVSITVLRYMGAVRITKSTK